MVLGTVRNGGSDALISEHLFYRLGNGPFPTAPFPSISDRRQNARKWSPLPSRFTLLGNGSKVTWKAYFCGSTALQWFYLVERIHRVVLPGWT